MRSNSINRSRSQPLIRIATSKKRKSSVNERSRPIFNQEPRRRQRAVRSHSRCRRSRMSLESPKTKRPRSPHRSKSIFSEEHKSKIREDRKYELDRLRHVKRREERLCEEERRFRDEIDGGKMREEEAQVRSLKRERLAREKELHKREKSLMKLKEEQENKKNTHTHQRSISRKRDASEHRITLRPRGQASHRRIKSSSQLLNSSRRTSSSRSVFDGNRLGDKISVKNRLGKRRRSSSRSRSREDINQ